MELTRCAMLGAMAASLGAPVLAEPFFDLPQPERLRYTPGTAAQLRAELYGMLGTLPPRDRPVSAQKVSETERDGYVLETLILDLNGFEPAPAFLARPKGLSGRAPAVLFNHSHGGNYSIGKNEFIEGREYLAAPPYAKALTDMGCIGLCVDTWVFGERAHTSEMDMFKAMLWQGRVLWGMMVYDSIKALEYLGTRGDVDPARIGTLGISMGSTMAWWLAALDQRVAAAVDICCLTDLHTLLHEHGLGGHGIYYYVPGLIERFSTSDINALIAPRPHLALAGIRDKLTPPKGLDVVDAHLKEVYTELGAPDNWQLLRYDEGHKETEDGRRHILEFLAKHLG